MSRTRWFTRFIMVAAVVTAVAGLGAGSVAAKGVAGSSFPSPSGTNGWYTSNVSGTFAFDVDGLGHFSENGYYHERLSSLECGGLGLTYTPPPESFFPFIPGNPQFPVQQSVLVSGDTSFAGTTVGCTAGYERIYFSDCHESIFGDYCLVNSGWIPAGTETNARTFKIDTTFPTNVVVNRTSDPNIFGWYNSPVTFTVSGSDSGSGIAQCGFGNFNSWSTPSITVNSNIFSGGSGAGCRDAAGNGSGTGVSWRYDNTVPALAPTVSPTGVLLRGSAATASPNATDLLSGVDPANTGCDPVDTSVAGSLTVQCHAADKAGNTNTANAAYKVGFGFTGFSAPVDADALNIAKAGQAVPLKFHVSDANGPVTSLTGYTLTSNGEGCDDSEPTDAIEAYAAGASGLQNLGGGNYQINWKTDKAFAGQCRQVNLTVGGDTTVHSADFKFVK